MVSASFLLSLAVSCATFTQAVITDLPSVFGPILSLTPDKVPIERYLKSRPGEFVHPGLWHSHEDLERIRTNTLAGKEPWASAYRNFSADTYSSANYVMQGPFPVISRGKISNYTSFTRDARAAWQNALMWYITKDQAHWNRSTTILDGWGSTLVDIIGTDRSLLIGLDGDFLVNAAEIMRWEGGWKETGAIWRGGSGFSNQLYWLFSRQSIVVGQANYGLASIKSMLSFAVYLDDVALYNYAINELLNNPCTSLFAQFEPRTGQSVESGRDQGHVMAGIAWMTHAFRTVKSQGSDLWGLGNNLLLRAGEYTAKFNQNGTVPYDPKWFRCEAILVDGPWPKIAEYVFGITNQRPVWSLLYYEYVKKRRQQAPWVTKAKELTAGEGAITTSMNDYTSWGDLIWAY